MDAASADLLARANAALEGFFASKATVQTVTDDIAALKQQLDQAEADLGTAQAGMDGSRDAVKAVYSEILGNL
jgi:hypothetical protein